MNNDDKRRYARHLILPEIGASGQAQLLSASALIVGTGGLGASAAGYLAAMGIGRLGLVDADRVELSNLQRQILFETADIGRSKVDAAADRLNEIVPDCTLETHMLRLDEHNAASLVSAYDIILDCTDNFDTRFALHSACYAEQKPLVLAAISGFSAQLTTFKAYLGAPHPCYRCLIPESPDVDRSCAQEGIIGALAGVMGAWQALEAVKELLHVGQSLSGRLVLLDALSAVPRIAELPRDAACRFCGG